MTLIAGAPLLTGYRMLKCINWIDTHLLTSVYHLVLSLSQVLDGPNQLGSMFLFPHDLSIGHFKQWCYSRPFMDRMELAVELSVMLIIFAW